MDTPNLRAMKRSASFFISGGDLHFIVNEYRFRVHSYFFIRESRFFQQHLAVSDTTGELQGQGSSLSNAIVLDDHDVSTDEFEAFLKVFYNPRYSFYELTEPHFEWASILKLSNMWFFPNVKDVAVRELEKLTDIPVVDRAELYQLHAVDMALRAPLYAELATREEPLDFEEAERLGMKTAVAVFRSREKLWNMRKEKGEEMSMEEIQDVILSAFAELPASPTVGPTANGFASGSGSVSGSALGSPRTSGFGLGLNGAGVNGNGKGYTNGAGRTSSTASGQSHLDGRELESGHLPSAPIPTSTETTTSTPLPPSRTHRGPPEALRIITGAEDDPVVELGRKNRAPSDPSPPGGWS